MSRNTNKANRGTGRFVPVDASRKGRALVADRFRTKIAKQGNSLGVRIPKAMIDELGLKQGDPVHIHRLDGRIQIVRADDAYTRAMEIGRAFSSRYRRALARLAK